MYKKKIYRHDKNVIRNSIENSSTRSLLISSGRKRKSRLRVQAVRNDQRTLLTSSAAAAGATSLNAHTPPWDWSFPFKSMVQYPAKVTQQLEKSGFYWLQGLAADIPRPGAQEFTGYKDDLSVYKQEKRKKTERGKEIKQYSCFLRLAELTYTEMMPV